MAGEVALGSLWNALAAPSDQRILGQRSVRIFDFDVGKLYSTVGEVLDQVYQLSFCRNVRAFK